MLHGAFPEKAVNVKVTRGEKPEHVRVIFEVKGRRQDFEFSMPRGMYHSRFGWTGELDANAAVGDNSFTFGILSDGNALIERFAGLRARFDRQSLGTPNWRLGFEFNSYHQIWNGATVRVAPRDAGELRVYRTRQNFEPTTTVLLGRSVRLTAGTSFQRMQIQFPAAHTEAANAVIGTLRYDRVLETSGSNVHRLEAGYNLRAATRILDSDFVYSRHDFEFRYTFRRANHRLVTQFNAGLLNGQGPLFERFVLGNAHTLRGWNRYDLAPLGAERYAHNSVEYRYRWLRMFYDAGGLWNQGQEVSAKHSAGLGVQIGSFAMLVAFPIKSGRAEPVFMTGLNL
jgi:hypothetical protein